MRSDALPKLDAMTIGELRHLYETYRSASLLFGWRAGQPWADGKPSGAAIDHEVDRCLAIMDTLFFEARRRNVPPCSIHAGDMLAIWALRLADDPGEIRGAAAYIGALAA